MCNSIVSKPNGPECFRKGFGQEPFRKHSDPTKDPFGSIRTRSALKGTVADRSGPKATTKKHTQVLNSTDPQKKWLRPRTLSEAFEPYRFSRELLLIDRAPRPPQKTDIGFEQHRSIEKWLRPRTLSEASGPSLAPRGGGRGGRGGTHPEVASRVWKG